MADSDVVAARDVWFVLWGLPEDQEALAAQGLAHYSVWHRGYVIDHTKDPAQWIKDNTEDAPND